MLDAKIIGERLRELRGEKSVAAVANAVGVSASAISNYEAGDRIPRDEVKVRLAKYYKTSVEKIFFK